MKSTMFRALLSVIFVLSTLTIYSQTEKSVVELFTEIQNYPRERMRELQSKEVSITREKSQGVMDEKRSLAKQTAKTVSGRTRLSAEELYLLGMMYIEADDEKNALETFKKSILSFPADSESKVLQSVRQRTIILAAKQREIGLMASTYESWVKNSDKSDEQNAAVQDYMATAYFKEKNYEKSIFHGEEALKITLNLPGKSWQERKNKEQLYGNLVDLLTFAYKKNDRKDDAVNILAEGRALSFTIPSAELYRRVMQIVDNSGISEKKLMEKVESISKSEPAPELEIVDWLGQEPTKLEELRGKVVLLDFWATWCGPCISTFPRLRSWHKKYSDDGFMIIGVTRYWGKDGSKKMTPIQEYSFLESFKEKHKLPYGFAISSGDKSMDKYGVAAYPTTVLLDRKGVVRYIGIGAGAEEVENLEDMIKKVMNEENIADIASIRNVSSIFVD